MQLERTIGLLGLTFVVVSGIIGSGWLFAPFLASQIAGPASVISWFIGGVAILILALCFAETTSILPVAGAIARLPHFTHGDVTSSVLGWSAWVGYNTAAPIETIAMLEYFRQYFPWLFKGETIEGNLTLPGMLVTVTVLAFFVVVNAWGVSAFVRANLWITVVKLLVPTAIPIMILFMHFTPSNFYSSGFAPNGMRGVFAAISSGGVIFAFIGFRHAVDLAGEVKRPNFTIPVALTSGLIICVGIYALLQIAFIGGLEPDEIERGWAGLVMDSNMAPMMGVVTALGLGWVNVMLYTGAIVAPFGGGLVATGSMARLGYALSQNGFFPKWLDKLSSRGVPLRALAMNFGFGVAVVLFISFEEAVAINGAAITISFSAGPLAVVALRKQLPDLARPFRLPAVYIIAPVSFVVATLIVYWGGWETNWRLGLVIGVGLVVFAIKMIYNRVPVSDLDLPQAIWLLPYGIGLLIFSYLGDFGGGGRTFGISVGYHRSSDPESRCLCYCLSLSAFKRSNGPLLRKIYDTSARRYPTLSTFANLVAWYRSPYTWSGYACTSLVKPGVLPREMCIGDQKIEVKLPGQCELHDVCGCPVQNRSVLHKALACGCGVLRVESWWI